MKLLSRLLVLSLITLVLFSCGETDQPLPQPMTSPAGPASELPNLHASAGGEVFLSWVEHLGSTDSVALRHARLESGGWGEGRTIASGDDWFVNWADYPSVTGTDEGVVAAHWLRKIPGGTYAYEVNMSLLGETEWSTPVTPHDDGTATEHGFVSLLPWNDASVLAIWLDGRNTADRADDEYFDLEKAMTLRSAVVGEDGVSEAHQIDSAVCDCCQTDLARLPGGAIAAYRDRTSGEIRDIAVSRYVDGTWEEPRTVHEDGWEIGGCPVNGPAIASADSTVAVAWFTGADDQNRVKAAVSRDAGETFGAPVAVDLGEPTGRVDVAITGSGRIYVSWMERESEAEASFMVREIGDRGPLEPLSIAEMSSSRSSGFPKMSSSADRLIFAWTDTGENSRVQTAVLNTDSR